jgi:23S rRNA (uracil1939-C5)-methyltransferase
MQLEAKAEILRDQLVRIGGFSDPPVRATIPSPQIWNYRNYVQFHLTEDGKVGYHKASTQEVFPIDECHLPGETINTTWPLLHFEPLREVDRVGIRLGVNDDVQLILESKDLSAPELSVEDLPLSVVHLSPGGRLVLAGSDFVYFEVLKRLFRVSGGAFFQINTAMAEAMVSHLLEYIPLEQTDTVLDLYCGVGLFSAFLAPKIRRLIGVESNPTAGEDFVANLDEFDNVTLYEAEAEVVLPELHIPADVVIVDPPRAGLSRAVREEIIKLQPTHLVYVSCDPATLARDARYFHQAGYQLLQMAPFDLFPQTYHVESISFWERDL